MNVNGRHYRTIWQHPNDPSVVQVIDQTKLPFAFEVRDLRTAAEAAHAIQTMIVRGAGLIGATAGYGMMLAAQAAPRRSMAAFLEQVAQDGAAWHGRWIVSCERCSRQSPRMRRSRSAVEQRSRSPTRMLLPAAPSAR
jgi:hypothetical protein